MSIRPGQPAPAVRPGRDDGLLACAACRPSLPKRRRDRVKSLFLGKRAEPPAAFLGVYEPPSPDENHIGICCSGGGIRSAAFNLGALQAMQEPRPEHPSGVLQNAKYLAAVSGGSYIASAFSMVAKTWCGDWKKDVDDSDPALVTTTAPPFHPGSPEEQYLRNHLGYLAPDGLARVHLALRMLSGLVVNVLLIGLPLFIAGMGIGALAHAKYGGMAKSVAGCPATGCHYVARIPDAVTVTILALTGTSLVLAVVGVMYRPRHDWKRRAMEAWEGRLLVAAVAGALALILVPWLVAKGLNVGGRKHHATNAGGGPAAVSLTSVIALFTAALTHVRGRIRDEQRAIASVQSKLGKHAARLREVLVAAVVTLAGPALLLATATSGATIAILVGPADPDYWKWFAGASALLAVMWWFTDLTSVSLHPFYRRRLCTAFALRRVWVRAQSGEVEPAPSHPAERWAEGRIEAHERDYDRLVPMSLSGVEPDSAATTQDGIKTWPMLIVCAAANVSDPGATPPGRGVASFTFSPRAIGGPLTGAANTEAYEHDLARNRRRDVTLPAAVAMSGAALSPSMGKMTYRPMTFLLGLANIRLGVWVLNPARLNESRRETAEAAKGPRWKRLLADLRPSTLTPWRLNPLSSKKRRERNSQLHRPRASYLWRELLGHNSVDAKFLYITDGGHYENLGLVELLRRGCRTVYCFDAGGGMTSDALADAIELAHSELNVDIIMSPETEDLVEEGAPSRAKHACARGIVRYPNGVTGALYYVRSVVTPESPWEVRAYQKADDLFPHHSTLNQFFSDRCFEAYRALGHAAAEEALDLGAPRGPAPSTSEPEPEPVSPAPAR